MVLTIRGNAGECFNGGLWCLQVKIGIDCRVEKEEERG